MKYNLLNPLKLTFAVAPASYISPIYKEDLVEFILPICKLNTSLMIISSVANILRALDPPNSKIELDLSSLILITLFNLLILKLLSDLHLNN